jgi:hypothetical protein
MFRNILRVSAALILFALLILPLSAFAHDEVEVGNYLLTIGWTNEPVIVSQPNGLDLYITTKDEHAGGEEHTEGDAHSSAQGVTGAESTLKFTIEYGGASQSYDLRPVSGEPGRYIAVLIPTREGQYTFRLTGAINGETADVKFEPEEVESAGKLAFPEPVSSPADLAAQLAAAQAQASTAQLIALVGVVLGAIGGGVGVYALMKK